MFGGFLKYCIKIYSTAPSYKKYEYNRSTDATDGKDFPKLISAFQNSNNYYNVSFPYSKSFLWYISLGTAYLVQGLEELKSKGLKTIEVLCYSNLLPSRYIGTISLSLHNQYNLGVAVSTHSQNTSLGKDVLFPFQRRNMCQIAYHPYVLFYPPRWVAYQYPGYRGYQYILERDRQNGEYRKYTDYSSQAHSSQIQSIRRVQH